MVRRACVRTAPHYKQTANHIDWWCSVGGSWTELATYGRGGSYCLARLPKRLGGAPADQRPAQMLKRQMKVLSAFISGIQALESVETAQCAFNDPAIAPQALARLDAAGQPGVMLRLRRA
jgi:hypothetical protein